VTSGLVRTGFVATVRPAFKGDGEAVARRGLRALQERAPALGAELVATEGVVLDAADAIAAGRRLEAAELDVLVVQHATFATGDLLAPLLAAAPRVIVWGVPESAGGRSDRPGVDGRRGPLPLNSLCGLNMTLSFAEGPRGGARGPVGWCYGDVDDPALHARLQILFAAERGALALRRARVLSIGGTAPGFYGLDDPALPPGATVIEHSLADLFDRVAAVPEADAAARAEAWEREEPLEAPREHLERAARIDLALAGLARETGADALAVRCWPELPDACGAMACAAMGRSADRRVPAACEGDVLGALSMLVLQAVADAPAALLDLSDLDREHDRLLLWHCGNAPRALAAAPGTRLTTHFNRDGVGVVRDQTLLPGPATALRLLDGGRRVVAIGGVVAEATSPSFDGVRGWWGELVWGRERLSAERAVASVLDRRLPHHLALVGGNHRAALLALTERLGAELVAPSRGWDVS
jgi:hypothetical protein